VSQLTHSKLKAQDQSASQAVEVFVATTSAAELVSAIKVLIAKGDKASDKAQQFYISAGQHLKVLKSNYTASWSEWEKLLKEKCQISTGRASELMQIADGRKTVAEVRGNAAERNRQLRSRKSSSSRDEDVDGKAKAKTAEARVKVTTTPVESEDETGISNKDRKKAFLILAASAIESAQKLDQGFNIKPDAEIIEAARYASDEWTKLADKLENKIETEPEQTVASVSADLEQNLIKQITSAVRHGNVSQRADIIGFIRNAIIDLALRVDEIETTKDWSGSERRCAKKILAAFD
jgi:hypothetical protein